MKYKNGRTVSIGDKVLLGSDTGVVVFSIDTDEYSDEFPKAEWSYLHRGVMIKFPMLGLVHIEEDDPALLLIESSQDI